MKLSLHIAYILEGVNVSRKEENQFHSDYSILRPQPRAVPTNQLSPLRRFQCMWNAFKLFWEKHCSGVAKCNWRSLARLQRGRGQETLGRCWHKIHFIAVSIIVDDLSTIPTMNSLFLQKRFSILYFCSGELEVYHCNCILPRVSTWFRCRSSLGDYNLFGRTRWNLQSR